jgi:hypothetical protein
MLTADERFARIWPKVERAQKHLLELPSAIDTFHKSNPHAVSTRRDPQTRKLIYYASRAEPVPLSLSTIAGDAVQNLRAALDHLHQHLLMVGTNNPAPSKGKEASFYIDGDSNQPTHYRTSAPAKVQGLRQDAINALNAVEPYKGGKGHDLWVLNELSNIDKHRTLVMVGSAYRSMSMWPIMERLLERAGGLSIPAEAREALHKATFIRPADRKCPLKVGDELFVDAADAEPDEKIQFLFDVAINEPQVVEAEPALETLQKLANLVARIIADFKPCLE